MSRALDELLSILDIERLEMNLFRGLSPQVGWQRVFGGQVIGQALVAAQRTVEGRLAHSLHAYFLRAGDPAVPIIYNVDRIVQHPPVPLPVQAVEIVADVRKHLEAAGFHTRSHQSPV